MRCAVTDAEISEDNVTVGVKVWLGVTVSDGVAVPLENEAVNVLDADIC